MKTITVYAIYRGDTDWTCLYHGIDSHKAYEADKWARTHCMSTRYVVQLKTATLIR